MKNKEFLNESDLWNGEYEKFRKNLHDGEVFCKENLELLNQILLSNDVVKKFHKEYSQNKDFKKWLTHFLPEIDDCAQMEQNNPWHKYNVLDHILHSVEEMNKQTLGMAEDERRMLAFVMFLHDIGKPACHITRKKDGKVIDSFFNHNFESEKIARRVLVSFGFNPLQKSQIMQLVKKHDIFMFIRDYKPQNPYHKELTKELLREEIRDLSLVGDGIKLFKWLVLVGRADNLAQNEKMTGDALKLLEKTEEMLETI